MKTLALRFAGLALALWVSACQSQKIQSIAPSLGVDSSEIHFPLTAYGSSQTESLTLNSISTTDLTVTPKLSGTGASAYSLGAPVPSNIPGLGSQPLTIIFAPPLPTPIPAAEQIFNATLTIASNDPEHASTTIQITGLAQAPQLDVCWNQPPAVCLSSGPLTVQFGSVAPRPTADGGVVEVDVENLAQVPLSVTQLQLDGAAQDSGYSIEEAVQLPLTLSPVTGLTDVLHIKLTPLQAGPATGTLTLISTDPRSAGAPVTVSLNATVLPFQPPVACLGINEIDYITGQTATVDPTRSLSAQPGITPPGPLDSVVITANVDAGCSFDPQDGQKLGYQFGLAPPTGSSAQLAPVTGHPEEQKIQFDLTGLYQATVKVTDSANLTASASLAIPVTPQDDVEAQLVWPGINEADLDLHLVRQLSDAGTASLLDDPQNDCFYCNCLLPLNYSSGSSPCNVNPGANYPILLQWGASPSPTIGDPLLIASQRFEPFPTENLDDVRLTGPQPGATYGLYASYYQAYQNTGICTHDSDCTANADYPTCSAGGKCMPLGHAALDLYVDGQNISDTLFDGGLFLETFLLQPCDLWHVGDLKWVSGGHFSDGGFATPVYSFIPSPADGGVTHNPQPGSGPAGISCLAQ